MGSGGEQQELITTGTPGFDDILGGGLPRGRLYLLRGEPGVGKTTLALRFLLAAVEAGEPALYVALSESRPELEAVARAHGWSLEGLTLHELTAGEEQLQANAEQTMFHPAEVELSETTRPLLEKIDRLKPTRVVIDSLSELRLLAREPLRYRRQILALKQFFATRNCTVLLTDDKSLPGEVELVQTIAHGVFTLEKLTPLYGSTRRRISVDKLRGVHFREGYHDYRITTGGLLMFPRLVASEHAIPFTPENVGSGVPELDSLLAGGLDRGTSALFIGAAGTGKSSLASQYALAAAGRGERVSIYSFEESLETWRARAVSIGLDPAPFLANGQLQLTQVDPAELSPGELAFRVRNAVEQDGTRLVVLDSLNGYLQSVPEENFLLLHLHELLTYLGQRGVTTLLVIAQHGLVAAEILAPVDVSYLADTVVLLRYFEAAGEVRQAISVVKKRRGRHERSIREFKISSTGLRVGPPLVAFHGVLTGVPTYQGGAAPLIADEPKRC